MSKLQGNQTDLNAVVLGDVLIDMNISGQKRGDRKF